MPTCVFPLPRWQAGGADFETAPRSSWSLLFLRSDWATEPAEDLHEVQTSFHTPHQLCSLGHTSSPPSRRGSGHKGEVMNPTCVVLNSPTLCLNSEWYSLWKFAQCAQLTCSSPRPAERSATPPSLTRLLPMCTVNAYRLGQQQGRLTRMNERSVTFKVVCNSFLRADMTRSCHKVLNICRGGRSTTFKA